MKAESAPNSSSDDSRKLARLKESLGAKGAAQERVAAQREDAMEVLRKLEAGEVSFEEAKNRIRRDAGRGEEK